MPSDTVQCADGEQLRETSIDAETIRAHAFGVPPTPPEIIEWVKEVEGRAREFEQLRIRTEHVLHAGMYARTVHLPPMAMFTNVLIKIPTIMVVLGYCYILAGDKWTRLNGFSVIPASANRKQIVITKEPTAVTMLFPTNATTIEEAEMEFTDETGDLLSRKQPEAQLCLA